MKCDIVMRRRIASGEDYYDADKPTALLIDVCGASFKRGGK